MLHKAVERAGQTACPFRLYADCDWKSPLAVRDSPSPAASRGNRENLRLSQPLPHIAPRFRAGRPGIAATPEGMRKFGEEVASGSCRFQATGCIEGEAGASKRPNKAKFRRFHSQFTII